MKAVKSIISLAASTHNDNHERVLDCTATCEPCMTSLDTITDELLVRSGGPGSATPNLTIKIQRSSRSRNGSHLAGRRRLEAEGMLIQRSMQHAVQKSLAHLTFCLHGERLR